MKKHLIFIALFMCISMIPMTNAEAASEPVLKVKLRNYIGNTTQITIKTKGDFRSSDKKVLLKNAIEYKLMLENNKLALYEGSRLIGRYDSLTANPSAENNLLYINNRSYSGSFQFIQETINNKDYIRPINSIKMEEYLRGVVPYEMPASWHKEAVKAQAVAARTYALSYAKITMDDTISYQVYGGYEGEPRADEAVKETEGQVLKYKGRLISAVFSASNGGKTESNVNAWGSDEAPYFVIRPDTFDPKTSWSFEINKEQIDMSGKSLSDYDRWWSTAKEEDAAIIANIKSWLKNNGYEGEDIKITSIPELSFSRPSSGGRVTKGSITIEFLVKELKDSSGDLIPQELELTNVSASKIRAIIGNRVVLSYLIDNQENTRNAIKIEGKGDGHGVGLSQWGAKRRADSGQTLKDILAFYYPGTTLVKEYSSIEYGPPGMRDVTASHLFFPEISYLLKQDIITGFPDGTFRPNETVTRAQAAIMIGRALGLEGGQSRTKFKDVGSSSLGSGYIASAVEEGLIAGFPDNTYRPNAPVTRGQMAIFITRAFELKQESHVSFKDVRKESSAYTSIKRIHAAGITGGYPDGTFKPAKPLIRSEFSAFMVRAMNQ